MGQYSDHRQGPGSPDRNPEGDIGPSQGPSNDKTDKTKVTNYSGLALTDEDGNLVTFGENNTPVGLTQTYFDNNPQNIQSAYDAGLMGTGLASTFSSEGLLNTNSIGNTVRDEYNRNYYSSDKDSTMEIVSAIFGKLFNKSNTQIDAYRNSAVTLVGNRSTHIRDYFANTHGIDPDEYNYESVSYTHLTLPTKA